MLQLHPGVVQHEIPACRPKLCCAFRYEAVKQQILIHDQHVIVITQIGIAEKEVILLLVLKYADRCQF
ncbi:hypothetical protein D3C80_1108890 [compost metagenome]